MQKLFILDNTFDGGEVVASQPYDPDTNKGGQIMSDVIVANKKGNAFLMDSTNTKDIFFCGNTVKDVSIVVWSKRAVDRLIITYNSFIDATVYDINVANSTNTYVTNNQSV